METLARLQNHLNATPVEIFPGYFHKPITAPVECADGTSLSVQASENHYCSPRTNQGPYTSVEVWCIRGCSDPIVEFDYSDDEPSANVPIEDVVRFIDNHGGIVN